MKTLRPSAFLAAASLLFAGSASAADYYWDSNGTAAGVGATSGTTHNWDTTSAIWSTAPAGTDAAAYTFTNADKAIFGTATSATMTGGVTVTLSQPVTLNAIQFGKGTSSNYYTIAGDTITLAGTTPTIDTSLSTASGIGHISSTLVGTSGFKKTGNSVLRINGDLSGLSGVINLSAGTIALHSSANLGSAGSSTMATITMANGTTLSGTSSGVRTINNGVTINGNVSMGSSAGAGVDIRGNIDLGGAVRTLTFGYTAGVTINTYSGVISNGGLTKVGTSATLKLSGVNTYTGGTTLSAGTLNITSTGQVVANGTDGINITGGAFTVDGTIKLTSGSATIANAGAITLNGASSVLDLGSFFNGQSDGSSYQLITGTTATTGNFGSIRFSGATNFDTVNFDNTTGKLTFSLTAVPEPSTYGLLGAGVLGAASLARRRRKQAIDVA